MGQMPAVVEPHGQDGGALLEQRLVHGQVGVGAGVRLDVGVLGAEEGGAAVAGEVLDLVDDVVAAVVAPARVPLGVLVGEDRAGRRHDRRRGEVLRRDQLQGRLLAVELLAEEVLTAGSGSARRRSCSWSPFGCRVVDEFSVGVGAERAVEDGQLGDAPLVAPGSRVAPRAHPGRRRARRSPPTPRWCGLRSRRRWRGCADRRGTPWSRRARRRPGRRGPCSPPWRCRCRCRRRKGRGRPRSSATARPTAAP